MKKYLLVLLLFTFPLNHVYPLAKDGVEFTKEEDNAVIESKNGQIQTDTKDIAPTNDKKDSTSTTNINAVNAKAINDLQKEYSKFSINLNDYGIVISKDITTAESLITNIIGFLAKNIAPFCILVIMTGGAVLLVSAGQEDLQTRGKEIIFAGIVGLVVTLSPYMIVSFVEIVIYSLGK